MIEGWFPQEVAPYFSMLSLLALCALFEGWARKGRHRALVMSVWTGVIAFGGLLVGLAVIAVVTDQPGYVPMTLALSGGILTGVFAGTAGTLRRSYAEAEVRKTVARDI